MISQKSVLWMVCLIVPFLLAGCSGAQTASPFATPSPRPTFAGQFQTYASPTATITPTATPGDTATPLPSPTPTPLTHVIAKGEDLFGIAWRYRITLEELKAANPNINPQFLTVGATLVIPPSAVLPTSTPPPPGAVTPTPAAPGTGPVSCWPAQTGGLWCFWPLTNPRERALENVSALFTLQSTDGSAPLAQEGFLPLDLLPPGATLPISAYFADPIPAQFQAQAQLLSAIPQPEQDSRYLAVETGSVQVVMSPDRTSAQVNFTISLTQSGASASVLRAVVVAYNEDGQVVGFRRWEAAGEPNSSAAPLQSGEAAPVSVQIYALAGSIERVEVFTEARP